MIWTRSSAPAIVSAYSSTGAWKSTHSRASSIIPIRGFRRISTASARERGRSGMEREARYAAVGAFVLLVIAMAVAFVYWYSDSRERRDYVRYEVYFDGTVSGLARGAPVRYLGVEVGRVVRMRIDPRNSSRVEVVDRCACAPRVRSEEHTS